MVCNTFLKEKLRLLFSFFFCAMDLHFLKFIIILFFILPANLNIFLPMEYSHMAILYMYLAVSFYYRELSCANTRVTSKSFQIGGQTEQKMGGQKKTKWCVIVSRSCTAVSGTPDAIVSHDRSFFF